MFKYGDIIEYIDGTYDQNFNNAKRWSSENNATFSEIINMRKLKDNKLYRYFEIKEIILPEKPIEQLKIEKREEINHIRDAKEQGGFKYLGKTFDSDPISCIRIQGASQMAAQLPERTKPAIEWTCKDNSTIVLTVEELIGLSNALVAWSNECHQKATKLKEQVELAKTKEELDKIVW